MAPVNNQYRTWCKTCKEWMVHQRKEDDLLCLECGTKFTEILLSKIPTEQIQEQRIRWKHQQRTDSESLFPYIMSGYMLGGVGDDMFNENWNEPKVIESDAGQKVINEKERRQRQILSEERTRKRMEREEYIKKFSGVGRNDICLCGSNKKFKKCCLAKTRI